MKIKNYLLMGAMLMLSSAAVAQTELPSQINGHFRLTNPAFGDAMFVGNRYNISATQPSVTAAGSVFKIETGKVWSFAEEVAKLDARRDAGEITEEQHGALFQQMMVVDAWKGGFYPITQLRCQGVDYVEMIQKLADYCDDAIENYLNDEIPTIFEQYRYKLPLLCIFASDVINPTNIESVDTFRKWAESYLTRWRSVADFNMYLQPIYTTPVNDTDPIQPTGEFYITFKTPVYVGNMKKAQEYINNMVIDDVAVSEDEKLDLWVDSKVRILRAVAKDYPEGSPAYKFLDDLLGESQMDMVYLLGESEDGSLHIKGLPDTFGTNGVTITADDLAKCTWKFDMVDGEQPFAVQPKAEMKDADGFYYTTNFTDFAYQIQNAGTKAYYATAIEENGTITLAEIADGKVPAQTPVIIRSLSAELNDNKLVPLDEEVSPIEGNKLLGNFFETANEDGKKSIAIQDGKATFAAQYDVVPANSAYTYTQGTVDAISKFKFDTTGNKIYNLQGHMLNDMNQKGIYIVNGKKVIR